MIRFSLLLILSIFAMPASAADRAMLTSPSDTIHMRAGAAEIFAYFQSASRGLEVTVLFTETEGQTWRTRVNLIDGQSHAIRLGGEEGEDRLQVSLRRIGSSIEIIGDEDPGLALTAAN